MEEEDVIRLTSGDRQILEEIVGPTLRGAVRSTFLLTMATAETVPKLVRAMHMVIQKEADDWLISETQRS